MGRRNTVKAIVNHPVYGEIVCDENLWTGKKTITINAANPQSISKKEYMIGGKKALIKGNCLTGSNLDIEGETIQLFPKAKWYEVVFACIPFIFLIIWGNSAALCSIFPVVGGALGGALGGIAFITSLSFMKKQKSPIVKVLIAISALMVTIFLGFLIAVVLIQFLV